MPQPNWWRMAFGVIGLIAGLLGLVCVASLHRAREPLPERPGNPWKLAICGAVLAGGISRAPRPWSGPLLPDNNRQVAGMLLSTDIIASLAAWGAAAELRRWWRASRLSL